MCVLVTSTNAEIYEASVEVYVWAYLSSFLHAYYVGIVYKHSCKYALCELLTYYMLVCAFMYVHLSDLIRLPLMVMFAG